MFYIKYNNIRYFTRYDSDTRSRETAKPIFNCFS